MASSHTSRTDRIVVGLDFGTTYSGLAWAATSHPDHRETITTWPAGDPSDKVPTKLRYAVGETQWGFGVPLDAPSSEVIEWFKLDLDPSLLPLKQAVADRAIDRGTDALVTDYISALLTHLTNTLTQRLGRKILASALDLILAVPAIWSDPAKARIRQICETASGTSVRLVPEPQAAAAHAIRELEPRALKVGDGLVVVDAGGGTVDLTSYTVRALNPLEVEESAPATGALCGSAFLDMRFARYLRLKLGTAEGFDDVFLAEAVAHFETVIKRLFTVHAPGGEIYPFPVPSLPDNESLGISDGTFALPVSELHLIFEPVILETTKLVSEHVSSLPVPPKAVILLGGFGGSEYLHERLREALGRVEILRPPRPWRAVAQGAVMKGLEGVEQQGSGNGKGVRRYGMELIEKYDERLHSSIRRRRHWCGLDGCYKVHVMRWFPEGHGEEIPPETIFHWTCPVSSGRVRTVKLDIYAREAAGPPPLSRDPTVMPLRRVQADLSGVPVGELNRRRGLDGRSYYDLRCGIEATRDAKGQRYAVVYNGRRYDAATVGLASSA